MDEKLEKKIIDKIMKFLISSANGNINSEQGLKKIYSLLEDVEDIQTSDILSEIWEEVQKIKKEDYEVIELEIEIIELLRDAGYDIEEMMEEEYEEE